MFMLEAMASLTGSGMAGAVFSLISDSISNARERKQKEMEIRLAQEARLQGQTFDFLNSPDGFVTTPVFSAAFLTLVRTYCFCIFLCILFPSRVIYTFDPDSASRHISFLWGIFEYDLGSKYVFSITLGGVAYGLLHLLAFQIGTVITGINPSQRQR